MINIIDKPHINPYQARDILEKHTRKGGVFIDLDKAYDYQSYYMEATRPKLKEFRQLSGDSYINVTSRNDIISILKNRFGLSESKLSFRGKQGIGKEVIKKLLDDEYLDEDVKRYLTIYRDTRKLVYMVSYLEQYIDLPLLAVESFENHRMVLARPQWEVLATGRISAKLPSVQNLTKDVGDIITYPKGYTLLRADSGQIEPRITYSHYVKDPLLKELIIAYKDAYYGMLRFILMSPEEEAYLRFKYKLYYEGQIIVPIAGNIREDYKLKVDVPAEGRKELKTILLAGNYGGNLEGRFDPVLARGFTNKIQQHPKRLAFENEVREAVRSGAESFTTVFGSVIKPEETQKYKKGTREWVEHLVRCGVNNPIQGTASDLMCESVYVADKLISNRALGETFIGYYKHDEGLFYVHEKDEALCKELEQVTAYQVRDWIPIEAEAEYGIKGGTPEFLKY